MSKNQKVTNLDYLIELSKGNETFVEEMIGIFLTENPIELQMLETAIRDEDFAMMKSYAHKMKSTIPFVGIDKFIEKDLSDIEMLSVDPSSLQRIRGIFVRVKEICIKANAELS